MRRGLGTTSGTTNSKIAGSKIEEVPGSHAIYVTNPEAVASIIKAAATGTRVACELRLTAFGT